MILFSRFIADTRLKRWRPLYLKTIAPVALSPSGEWRTNRRCVDIFLRLTGKIYAL